MGKYKKKLAWLLMFALCVGMIAFPDSGKVMPVRAAEETTQTEKAGYFRRGSFENRRSCYCNFGGTGGH